MNEFDQRMVEISLSQEEFQKEVEIAKNGNVDAQHRVGSYYFAEKNYEEAFYWLMLAAQKGDPGAQCFIGNCYSMGLGTSIDKNAAFSWYLKSAQSGDRSGQYNVAMCYIRGFGVSPDSERASYWLQLSASQGYQPAQELIYKIINRKGCFSVVAFLFIAPALIYYLAQIL